jgi:hypothetical protein
MNSGSACCAPKGTVPPAHPHRLEYAAEHANEIRERIDRNRTVAERSRPELVGRQRRL